MKQDLTELVFILDQSGSMHGLETDVIGGFNSLIEGQKKEPGEAVISLVLFDDSRKVIYDRVPLDEVSLLTDNVYCPGGSTALLDAVGFGVKHISMVHRYIREEDIPRKTLFVIYTDGMENSSRYFSYVKINKLITEKREKDKWEFMFLGANIDAEDTAEYLGLRREMSADFISDEEGTRIAFDTVGAAINNFRTGNLKNNWNKDIKADYNKRNKK